MKSDRQASLAEQARSIRGQLRAQRQRIADDLSPVTAAKAGYPRSMTMRLLINRPALLPRLAILLTGARFAGSVTVIVGLLQVLRAAVPVITRKALPAPPPANN